MEESHPWTLTVLINNYVKGAGLLAEHGLSLLLQREAVAAAGDEDAVSTLLFDTGQTAQVLAHNASALHIDPGEISAVVLSHGHYDHTGGLEAVTAVLDRRDAPTRLPVYAHPAAFTTKLKLAPERRDIGSPMSAGELEAAGVDLRLDSEPVQLSGELWTTGEVPRHHDVEKEAVAGFYTETDGEIVEDTIPDDQSLVLLRPDGSYYLICGCCHAGLLNTLDHAQDIARRAGVESPRVRGILGGLHTTGASEARLEATIAGLRTYDPEWIAPIHCSGRRETAVLHAALGDRVRFLSVGSRLRLA